MVAHSPDPDLERMFAKQVSDGRAPSIEEARADFHVRLKRSIAQADAGMTTDAEIVFARLRRRYAEWPRAAE